MAKKKSSVTKKKAPKATEPNHLQVTKSSLIKPEFISVLVVVIFLLFGSWWLVASHAPKSFEQTTKPNLPANSNGQLNVTLSAPGGSNNIGFGLQPATLPANSNDPELSTGLHSNSDAIGPAPTDSTVRLQNVGQPTQQTGGRLQ